MNDQNDDRVTQDEPGRRWTISRRGFLVGMAATGTALTLGIPLGLPVLRRTIAQLMEGDVTMPTSVDPLVWFEISADEGVRLFVTKAEMGQGIHTALAQIAAEELEVPWERLEVIHASTSRMDDGMRMTNGSLSVRSLYDPLRRGAATLREMLRHQAASYLNLPSERLVARDGGFELAGDPGTRVSYGTLVARGVDWQVPAEEVPLKPAGEFKVIGRALPRVDARRKVTGKAIYGYDARVEGMLYGAIARPPTLGARMLSARPGAAAGMPGVVQVVIEDGFAGVVARSRIQAAAARDALEIEWDPGRLWQQADLDEIVTAGGPGGVNIQLQGNASSVLARGTPVTAEYRADLGAHASLEPQAALADVNASGARVWTSTQAESGVRTSVAEALGVTPEQVEVLPMFLGGAFGRKVGLGPVSGVAVEAARLSRAVGAPVHVGWDRAEEMRHGFFRPPTHHRFAAALDDGGRIAALALHQASGDVLGSSLPEIATRIMGFDFGAVRGARILYDVPNCEVTACKCSLPIPTGPWRGLGLFSNTFPIESFVDELAHAAGADPLQFRLDHLPDNALGRRMRAVLETVAERAQWGNTLPESRARGLACCFDAGSVVAQVAEISLDRGTGQIRVHRVAAAMDCGRTINPDGVRSQMEGCIVMGTSAALVEELVVQDGRVTASNLDRYPLLRLRDAPDVEAVLVESPDDRPHGVGEPSIGPIAPAIGNAFFALTGVRLRHLPMTPARVKSALGV